MEILLAAITLYSIVITVLLVRANAGAKFDIMKIPAHVPFPEPWNDKIWAELAFGQAINEN